MATDRTRRKMTVLVQQWETSTDTREAFARRHGLTLASFEYWKRRVRRDVPAAEPVTFAPVPRLADRREPDSRSIDVVLVNGERVVVREGVSPDWVRQVVSALKASC